MSFYLPESILPLLDKLKQKRPVIQCITNIVTVNDCANIILAIGGSPTMAHHPEEVEEIQSHVHGLVCNLGATDDLEAMILAGKEANRCSHPVVVDPVGVAASTFRRKKCFEFLQSVHPAAIRGNHSEIRALIMDHNTAAGVDDPSDVNFETHILEQMKQTAKEWHTILIASGPTDYLTDGDQLIAVNRGCSMMSRITGSGCMSSALLGTFLAAESSLESAIAAVTCMGIAGEIALDRTKERNGGTQTFRLELIDAISLF